MRDKERKLYLFYHNPIIWDLTKMGLSFIIIIIIIIKIGYKENR